MRDAAAGGLPLFRRTDATREAYEKRIDELFSGSGPDNASGVKVLDRSDVLDLLGINNKPLHLVESKVQKGAENHPAMTAEIWKKVPDWIESPLYVFNSETSPGRLVFIAPETVKGQLVRMIVEPSSDGKELNLLVNAYDAGIKTPLMRWANDGLMMYADERKTREIGYLARLPRLADAHGSTKKIYTGADLYKYRSSRDKQNPQEPAGEVLFRRESVMTKDQIRQELKDYSNGKLTDFKPALLATIPLNYMKDFARDGMTAVQDYIDTKRKMDKARDSLVNQYDARAQDWFKWHFRNKADSQKLMDLMHDSRIPASTSVQFMFSG